MAILPRGAPVHDNLRVANPVNQTSSVLGVCCCEGCGLRVQWTLANPNSLGPEPIQISEIFGLVKATAAMCVIVTAPYLHSV